MAADREQRNDDVMLPNGAKIIEKILTGAESPRSSDDPLNLGELLLRHFDERPEFLGQIDATTGERTSFAEMKDRTVRCAVWLRKQGIKPGDMIGLCADNHPNAIVPFLASLCVGAVCVTWDHVLFPEPARAFLELTRPRIVFLQEHSLGILKEAARAVPGLPEVRPVVFEKRTAAGHHPEESGAVRFDEVLAGQTAAEVAEFRCENLGLGKESPAAIVSSSGTTGMPKGTLLSHRSLERASCPFGPLDSMRSISMWSPTIRWGYGIALCLKAMRALSTRIIVPDFDDDVAYCKFIEEHQVEWFGSDPFILMRLLKHGTLEKYRLPSLREILVTGAPFKPEAQQACANALPHVHIGQVYGMTDSGGSMTKQTRDSHAGSCGFILPDCRIKIADRVTGEALGPDKHGEICVKTAVMMTEYYKNPNATSGAFDSEGWLRTGDIGYYTAIGELYLVDRISEFINYRSINVSPAEIEAVLEKHPAVSKATVVSIPDEIDGEQPIAVVVRVPEKQVREEELTGMVDAQLPDYCKLRGGVIFVEKLPLTATKKIARNEVRKMVRANSKLGRV